MDFKQIEAFISVARLKSFSKAANNIYLSQPTISSHISSLEKELNIQLFDRNSKEVNLTPAGRCFLDYAVDIINTRNNAINCLCDFDNNISGTLVLGASTTPCNTIVPSLVNRFSAEYPHIKFNIIEQSSGEIIQDIIDLNCEIGIVGSLNSNEKIKSYCLMEDELLVISSPALKLPKELTLDEFLKYKIILREKNSATRKTFEDVMQEKGLNSGKINLCCEVNNLDTLIQFVKTGMGISIISKCLCKDYEDLGLLNISTIKDVHLTRNIYLVLNSKRTLTPTAKAFFEMCKNEFNIE
ncbi:selenium metabolism-associated LysR family transcriptional regulator [Clostridium frigidicarnis]|uniref:DNA-binding transcriptional regulator, LysR family n=1 Tax=Clostridium frigidicarnis TaxID=84698 RepID=A0A1I1ANK4_9CLOT|nr:selenium metabolism-associated LysR family transcriptional regulator [Clostridium frigidicarnis]SFB39604.1 DNA-binding transcriptional regulator, LysR family [Clostridium frigidicarnis]